MTSYKKLFTNYGQEKITDAVCDEGEVKISKIVIGDGNGALYEPSKTQTELVNQLDVLDITDFEKNGNVCRFFAEIPSDTDYYIIREIGLTDDEDNLIWVSQFEMETVSNIDNVVTENIIGIQLEFEQGVTVSLVDTSVLTASKDYVDATFQKLSEKGEESGYCPLDENAKIPEFHLPYTYANINLDNLTEKGTLQTNIIPYSSVSGNYNNATGYPDLISYSGSTASFKVSDHEGSYIPLRTVFTDGVIREFVSISDLSVSGLANGTYNLYLDKDGVIHPFANHDYASRIVPAGGSSTIVYVNKYQLSSNLTKVGNPTINTTTGLATNFTSSNYFKTNASNYSKTNWEMQIKFQASNVTDSQPLCGYYFWRSDIGRRYTNNVNIIISSGKVHIYIGLGDGYYYTGTGLDVSDGGFDISTNNFYTLNISYENGIYTTIFTNNSDSTIITKTLTSSYKVAWNSDFKIGARTQPKEGTYSSRIVPATYCTIDLMNTYVKSNGEFVISNVIKEKEIITTGGNLTANDIWLDTSVKPYVLRQYDGTSNWSVVDYVRLPQQITVSSGAITGVVNVLPYNANGWDEQLSTPDMNRQTTLTKGSQFTTTLSGYVYNQTEGDTYYLEKGTSFTPASGTSGTWYFSPIKGA